MGDTRDTAGRITVIDTFRKHRWFSDTDNEAHLTLLSALQPGILMLIDSEVASMTLAFCIISDRIYSRKTIFNLDLIGEFGLIWSCFFRKEGGGGVDGWIEGQYSCYAVKEAFRKQKSYIFIFVWTSVRIGKARRYNYGLVHEEKGLRGFFIDR